MKKSVLSPVQSINKFLRTSITISLLFLTINVIHGQEYKYPIKPGTSQWENLNTHDDMMKVAQIPDTILSRLSTKDLIKTCINYPLALEFLAFSNYKLGYQKTFQNFNGYNQLINRKDVGKEFLSLILELDINMINNNSTLAGKGRFIYNVSLYELMITDYNILSTLNQRDLVILLKDLRNKLDLKNIYSEYFGSYGLYISAFAFSQILLQLNKLDSSTTDKSILLFANNMQLNGPEVLSKIIQIVDSIK
jgi:hypothetical protein